MVYNIMNILAVEDHEPTRSRLVNLLKAQKSHKVVAVGDAETALERIRDEVPDLIIMDLGLPGISGIDAITTVKKLCPAVEILVFTVMEDDDKVFASLRAGASGYLLKDATSQQILASLDEIKAGGAPMSFSIARKVLGEFQKVPSEAALCDIISPLSNRETAILEMLYKGDSYKEIADKLCLSIHTVHTHIKNTYVKLQVNSRSQAIYEACRQKIIKQ